MPTNWIWSEDHQDHYYVTSDANGNRVYIWASQQSSAPQATPTQEVQRYDYGNVPATYAYGQQQPPYSQQVSYGQGSYGAYGYPQQNPQYPQEQSYPQEQHLSWRASQISPYQQPPDTAAGAPDPQAYPRRATVYVVEDQVKLMDSLDIRNRRESGTVLEPDSNVDSMAPQVPRNTRVANLIHGTPERGWYEALDSSYRMRTGREAHEFFKKGRVFAMLWAEPASETFGQYNSRQTEHTHVQYNDPVTVGRFGQAVFSQIRRFVIMRVKKKEHFVYACQITTYRGRATLKPGCNPNEHTIIHFEGTEPQYIDGEEGNSMDKDPIRVQPTNRNETMDPASRLRFGKTYPVEWNVKVKDIGKVHAEDMSKLVRYWKEVDFYDSGPDED